jgi:hypothetical protein
LEILARLPAASDEQTKPKTNLWGLLGNLFGRRKRREANTMQVIN